MASASYLLPRSEAPFSRTPGAMVTTQRKRVQGWRFLDPILVSGPTNCPESIARYVKAHYKGSTRLSLAEEAKKHLFFLGWKIECADKKGALIYRYTSPEGEVYYSLIKVCQDLSGGSPVSAINRKRCSTDCVRRVDSRPKKLHKTESLDDSSDDDDDGDYLPGLSASCNSRSAEGIKRKYSAVTDWHMIALDKSRDSKTKSKVKAKAVAHLLASGWELFYIQKKERRELRYKSPAGKIYISLRTACKAVIDKEGAVTVSPVSENTLAPVREKDDEDLHRAPKVRRGKDISVSPVSEKTAAAPREKDDDDLRRAPKVRRGKDMALLMQPKVGSAAGVGKSRKDSQQVSSNRNPRTVLFWLMDNNVVLPRDKVCFRAGKEGPPLAWGRIATQGIKCDCCSQVFNLSRFAAHAGSLKRRPAANIFLEGGRSLFDCQKELNQKKAQKSPKKSVRSRLGKLGSDHSDTICSVCHFGGDLIACERCPALFHGSCLYLKDIPAGEWYCPSCCCLICGRGRYHDGGIFSNHLKDGDFLRCVQCERDCHRGCLKSNRALDLNTKFDRENWFCSRECERIHAGLQKLLGKQIPVGDDNLTWTLLKCTDSECQDPKAAADTDAMAETQSKLHVALDVIHESFKPIMDPFSQSDLVEDVIFSRKSVLRRLDFSGSYTVLLERNEELITVATVRVFGRQVAEVPIVATQFHYRRRGMCRTLMDELESQLMKLGVERLTLPAAHSALNTWISSFDFSKMTDSDRSELLHHILLNFQDTTMCQKLLTDFRPQKRMKHTLLYDDIDTDTLLRKLEACF